MSELMKLKDVYITWKNGKIDVVPKSAAIPCSDKHGIKVGYYDYADWPGLTPAEFFLEQFTSLTYDGKIKPANVQEAFEKIAEYIALDEKALHSCRRGYKAA